MFLAYSLLLTLGLLALIPHFLFQALAHGKYIAGLRQRLGSLPSVAGTDQPIIWLHCVSVGESQAARPLVERLRNEFPDYALVVSTITLTGQRLARDVFGSQADCIFYFPFDWRWSVRRALKRVNPAAVLIMETELWPNFLHECRCQDIPVVLVNGRISRQSFRRYRLVKFFLRRVLSCLSLAVMQSEGDRERIQLLGMPTERVVTAGNLKFDTGPVPYTNDLTREIGDRFNIQCGIPLILAASTHAPEEKILLESFQQLRKTRPVRLMLAPRHPERFREVAALLQNSGLTWARRTSVPKPEDQLVDIVLLDTIGELPATFSLATVVFVGGSIVDKGGHNVLEPAVAGACIITGAYTHNFAAIVDLLNESAAIVQLPVLDVHSVTPKLTEVFGELLADPERRSKLASRAKELVDSNQGVADRTISFIAPLLDKKLQRGSRKNSQLATNTS
jgi:3-deoxy-D-manno-octulosonic-acid transferase